VHHHFEFKSEFEFEGLFSGPKCEENLLMGVSSGHTPTVLLLLHSVGKGATLLLV
jgi:hypothetical protein